MLKRGTAVIINDIDAPEARMVAVLMKYDDVNGIWHGRYLSTWTNRVYCASSGNLGEPTPLADFGMMIEFDGHGMYRVVPTGERCRAKYRDGLSRRWQDETPAWRLYRRPAKSLMIPPDTPKTSRRASQSIPCDGPT